MHNGIRIEQSRHLVRRTAVLGFLVTAAAGTSVALAAPGNAASPTPSPVATVAPSTSDVATPTLTATPVPAPSATAPPTVAPVQIQVPAGNARQSSGATPWLQIGLAGGGSLLVIGAGVLAASRR